MPQELDSILSSFLTSIVSLFVLPRSKCETTTIVMRLLLWNKSCSYHLWSQETFRSESRAKEKVGCRFQGNYSKIDCFEGIAIRQKAIANIIQLRHATEVNRRNAAALVQKQGPNPPQVRQTAQVNRSETRAQKKKTIANFLQTAHPADIHTSQRFAFTQEVIPIFLTCDNPLKSAIRSSWHRQRNIGATSRRTTRGLRSITVSEGNHFS